MPRIHAIHGITYNADGSSPDTSWGNVISSHLTTPPDTLTPALIQKLRDTDVLTTNDSPALYILRQTYKDENNCLYRSLTLLCGVEINHLNSTEITDNLVFLEDYNHLLNSNKFNNCASSIQTTPICGLYNDSEGGIEDILRRHISTQNTPDTSGVMSNGTLCELWTVSNFNEVDNLIKIFRNRKIIIAGNYEQYGVIFHTENNNTSDSASSTAKPIIALFALTALQDPGLSVKPVHKIIYGLNNYTIDRLVRESEDSLIIAPAACQPFELLSNITRVQFEGTHRAGLYDFSTDMCYTVITEVYDPLADILPDCPVEWRRNEHIIFNHLLNENILQNKFNNNQPVKYLRHYDLSTLTKLNNDNINPQLCLITKPVNPDVIFDNINHTRTLPCGSVTIHPDIPCGMLMLNTGDPPAR